MSISPKKETIVLFLGDIFFFFLSLWVALFFRFGQSPSLELFKAHVEPFSILFVLWVIVFYIAGLYDKHTLILKSRLPGVIFNSQVVNSILAVLFFYLFPSWGITPKTILFIYLVVSFIAIVVWRLYGTRGLAKTGKQPAL